MLRLHSGTHPSSVVHRNCILINIDSYEWSTVTAELWRVKFGYAVRRAMSVEGCLKKLAHLVILELNFDIISYHTRSEKFYKAKVLLPFHSRAILLCLIEKLVRISKVDLIA